MTVAEVIANTKKQSVKKSEPGTSEPPPPLDQWWTGFQDPTLTQIVERTLRQNLELTAALA